MQEIEFNNITLEILDQYKKKIFDDFNTAINSIVVEENRDFKNTIQPLINMYTLTEGNRTLFSYVTNFYPQKELRDNALEIKQEIAKFLIDCSLRKDLYNAIKEYVKGYYLKEKNELTPEETKYIEKTMWIKKEMVWS